MIASMFQTLNSTLLARDLGLISFSSPKFLMSLFFMLFNPLYWNILGRLEYRKKILSKLFGGHSKIACYALALSIFCLGLYRDYLFTLVVKSQPQTEILGGLISKVLGPVFMTIGYAFVITSTLRLGIIGTFLGDYFGFLMKSRVTGFPYNVSTHPMYEGSTMVFLGYSLWNKSFVGIILTAAVAFAYSIASHFEGKFTTMIYEKAANNHGKKVKSK